uniref:DUF1573 domain-containing protein n=1 Tax=Flavobacterium sp. TaxID=239 RepID=UPI00404A45B6
MKTILPLLILFFGNFIFAQGEPKIEFSAEENTIDYGTIYKNEDDGIRVFEFKNIGNAPLLIKHAQSTCGCTVPTWTKEPIAPGKTGKIEVRYNMQPGPIRKTIAIETNAVNVPDGKVALRIKGEVLPEETSSVLEKKKPGMIPVN